MVAYQGQETHLTSKFSSLLPRIALAGLLGAFVMLGLALSGGPPVSPAWQPLAPFDQFEALISQTRRVAEQNPNDPQAWIAYGNALYDSVQIMREQVPDSSLYLQRLPRWLQAIEVYSRALALQPDNAATRADLGASACFYGAGTSDMNYVASGLREARRAAQAAPDNPRVLVNLGFCLINTQPPQIGEALQTWSRVVQLAPEDSLLATRARHLIEHYGSR